MAHLLYTGEQVVNSALAVLQHNSTLARIVNSDYSNEFVPGKGATVTVKGPVMIDPAKTYTKAQRDAEEKIEYSDLYQEWRSLRLSDQVYQAVKLPDDFATFTLTNLEDQVVRPMAESVAERVNDVVSNVFANVRAGSTRIDRAVKGRFVGENGVYESLQALRDADDTFIGKGNGLATGGAASFDFARVNAATNGQVLRAIRAASQVLNRRGVPRTNRYLVVGAGWEAAIMSQDILNKANEAGTSDLLRQATLGNLYGFTVATDYTIDPYDAYALNRDAVTLSTRVTAAPRGASFSATTSAGGFTMRYLHDYDPTTLRDRAVIDLFAGAELLDGQRVLRMTGTPGFEEKTDDAPADAGDTAEPTV